MKYLFTITLLITSIISNCQDFKLFNADSKKLYTTFPSPGPTYGIAFDSVVMAGDYSIYFNYTGIGEEIESDTCIFWGPSSCLQQDKPSWLGYATTIDFMGTYQFMTDQGNFLSFNFNLSPGDSMLFYQDAIQQFYMVYEGIDNMTCLSVPDSVKYYRIAHYDNSGNPVYSMLNNEEIMIGKEMGLVNFFRIDSFPIVLQPVTLLGNFSPPAGIVDLTNEMVYDHHPGDEIQYLDQYYNLSGPPYQNYKNYIKHTFLDRIDTQDSIYYSVGRITYKTDSNIVILDTIILKYDRNKIIAEIPFDRLNQEQSLVIPKFYKADYCDLKLWTYSLEPQFLVYCPIDNCWGSYDIPGPPPDEETVYVCGLGLYLDRSAISAPPPEGYSHVYKVIYFKKDGAECGEEVAVGLNEGKIPVTCFTIFPNPANDKFYFRQNLNAPGTLIICDLYGHQLMKLSIRDQLTQIDTESLKNGIYLLKFIGDSFADEGKFVVEK